MGKLQISNDLQKRRTTSSLLAVSLAASLAAFGCTTNLNPGNGTPTRTGPELRSAPTSGVSTGTERVTSPPQSMTSSYNSAQVLPPVTPRSVNRGIPRRSAAEAAAIMAGAQALRGRYLGVVNPGPGNRPYHSDGAGGLGNPALATNPQMTINSTISSPAPGSIDSAAFPVTAGGAGILGTGVATTGTTAGINTTAASTLAGTGTTTATGIGLPAGTLATVRPATTETIGNNPGVTSASVGVGRAGVPVTGTATTAVTATPTTAATATTVTAASSAAPSVTGGVRVVRGDAGAVTITNASNGSNQQ